MNRCRAWVALLAWLAVAPAIAQSEMGRGEFLRNHPAGSLAIVLDVSDDIHKVKRLMVLSPIATMEVRRRARCLVAVSHRDLDRAGETTFVGIQLIRFFDEHGSPGALFTARNAGWFSATGKSPLPEVPAKELLRLSLDDFVVAHADDAQPRRPSPLFGDGRTPGWHALASSQQDSYSGNEEHRRFWAMNPLEDVALKKALGPTVQGSKDVRVENRLYRFVLTESVSSRNMPYFAFTCTDPRLKAAAFRVYRPFATEPHSWGFLKFK